MHRKSAWHVRGEVLTGSAFGSAGRPSAAPWQEGSIMDSGMVPEDLVQRWQAIYSEYIAVDRSERLSVDYPAKMARLAASVASAWRDMAATPGLPWWQVASLTTSAEAFEQQAVRDRSRAAVSSRPTERGGGSGSLHPGPGWYQSLGPEGPGGGGGR